MEIVYIEFVFVSLFVCFVLFWFGFFFFGGGGGGFDRSRLFQKTIDSCQCFSTHLKTCVVAIDLESNRRFLI